VVPVESTNGCPGGRSLAILSGVFQALMMHYTRHGKGDNPYVLTLLVGMKAGVAGSLSTVSSFAKETVNLATSYPNHAKSYIYSTGTIIVSMLLGLAIYSPMVRNT
jgi:fluoride ion exporter CrcB/FEX